MSERKNTSYYGLIIEENFPKKQAWLQSEKLPEYLRFYVKNEWLDQLHNNSNHIICGRRGTGKTHLLGAFCEKVKKYHNSDELCVMMSASEFTATPPRYIDESIDFARSKCTGSA